MAVPQKEYEKLNNAANAYLVGKNPKPFENYGVFIFEKDVGVTRKSLGNPAESLGEKNFGFNDRASIKAKLDKTVCSGLVGNDYIDGAIDRNDIFFILHSYVIKQKRGGRTEEKIFTKAFILASYEIDKEGKNGIYLDIICATTPNNIEGDEQFMLQGNKPIFSYGKSILEYFLTFCKTKNLDYVRLSSLRHVLTYYPKYNFEFRKNCTAANPPVPGAKEKYLEALAVLRDKDQLKLRLDELSMILHKGGLTKSDSDNCKDPNISLEDFLKYGCDIDGFSMSKCNVKAGGGRRKSKTRRGKSKTRRGKSLKRRR
jgi:hypothetical protein